ncbi:retrovirus-related pol polyprotein from transposon TNT 1-94 [Tanacetum coccineum]
MSRDVITVGSTMRIPLLYRGEYSQWRERFMNYLEEQTDGEAMINSIQNGDHPLPVIAQVSLAGTAPNAPPTLKDPQFWTAEEKKNRKIDRLARSLLIQGLPNDIYSLIDSNDTAKDLWDALERQMRGSEYGEQDRKAAILYEYETFKATEGEQLLDTYLRYLQVINDLKKCGYKKDNCELNYKFLNNLQPEWKQYGTLMRQTKNLMDINIDALYNILKQNQGDVNDAMGYKKKAIVVTSDPLALVAEKTKVSKRKEKVVVQSESEGSDDEDISDLKKITALLAKAFNRKKYYAKPTNNNLRTSSASSSANKKPEYVKSEEKKEDKKVDEKKRDMSKVKCYNCKKEGHFAKDCKKAKVKDYNYYKTKMLLAKKDSDEQLLLADDQALDGIQKESSSSAEETIAEQTSSLKPYVPTLILEKIIIELEEEVLSLLEKEKENLEIIESLKSKGSELSENAISDSENQSEKRLSMKLKKIKKVTMSKVLGHNLFSVGQFCDKGLEVAFRKSTCFVRNEDGVDLLTGDRSSNLYTIALNEIASNSLACLLAKASSSQSWLWHQRLSHLNFATINNLVKNNLVRGLPKMKFEKDHLCSACEQGKIHRKHHKSKTAFASNKPLYLLHMDLCGPMRVESINGKRYVLVVVDDYSRYTWRLRTDNGTEFKNKTLAKFFDKVGISQQFFAARTPQQNGVVERRNRTLVEAARTMLTFANLPLFLWAEAIATACFNRIPPMFLFSMIIKDVGKLKTKGIIGVIVGYSKESCSSDLQ